MSCDIFLFINPQKNLIFLNYIYIYFLHFVFLICRDWSKICTFIIEKYMRGLLFMKKLFLFILFVLVLIDFLFFHLRFSTLFLPGIFALYVSTFVFKFFWDVFFKNWVKFFHSVFFIPIVFEFFKYNFISFF